MTTAYTSLLGLALPVTGELSGTWGDTVNNSITSLLDTSVAGTTNVSTDTDVTLTTTTGAANTARQAILLFSGARTALRTVTAPAQSKIYTVINATTGGFSVKLVGSGPTTGLTIPNGASAVVAWNGSDFVEVGAGSIGNLVVNGTLTVTGATTLQSTLAVTGNITNTAGTANGVAYLNGSKVVTSGSALTFDGTNLGVGTASPVSILNASFSGGAVSGTHSMAFGIPYAANLQLKSTNAGTSVAVSSVGLYSNPERTKEFAFYNQATDARVGYLGYQYVSGGAVTDLTLLNALAGSLIFGTNNAEGMRLTSTGLGIGTSSPYTKEEIVGGKLQVSTAGGLGFAGGGGMNIYTGAGARLYFYDDSNSATIGSLKVGGTNALTFSAGGATEQMRLDSSGNLGLGVTPSAWASGFKAVQIGSGAAFWGPTGTGIPYAYMSANQVYDTTSTSKYLQNNFATWYIQETGAHKWFNAPSGTAGNAITFTQAMTLDSAGSLLVGTTGKSFEGITVAKASATYVSVIGNTSNDGGLLLGGNSVENQANIIYKPSINALQISVNPASSYMYFNTAGTERARIDSSGNLLINTTTAQAKLSTVTTGNAVAGFFQNDASGYQTITVQNAGASGTRYLEWFVAGTTDVGSISSNGTITTYNTTSDYRLKTNQSPLVGSGAFIDALKPKTWNWVQDGSTGIGFIAHEFAEVSPSSVSGEKDAVDENGKPVYQSMQASSAEVIANLVSELQSLRQRVAQLEAQ
jgi:hypothetical protein